MTETNDPIGELSHKLDVLLKRQELFSYEIKNLSDELQLLKGLQNEGEQEEGIPQVFDSSENLIEVDNPGVSVEPAYSESEPDSESYKSSYFIPNPVKPPQPKSDIEKFIGENLINKIGILITIIGVAIGAKYSIDHNLISPVARILLGYFMGLGILGIGLKLKRNYENYSAVLVSGAIAILYFITFFAYSLYNLFPQLFAFALMLLFTSLGITAALRYNKQVIAHIGLVGAYAVPFLLSNDSGNISTLFSYIAFINIGILVIAFKKYWKPLYYATFAISWLVYVSWYNNNYHSSEHFALALIFLVLFFMTFYAIFLAYKLVQKEKFDMDDVMLQLTNSFIFYGIGYSILKTNSSTEHLMGMFSLCNAGVHFIVSLVIYREKLADRNLFFLVAGMVVLFITIAIPVQLDGNWVTLLWAGEAALLFWIGRTRTIQFYEILAYALILLTFFSIIQDWMTVYDTYSPDKTGTRIYPIFNVNFLTSALVVASFTFINILNRNSRYDTPKFSMISLWVFISFLIPALLFIVIYYSFRIEIETYWNQLYIDSNQSANSITHSLDGKYQDSYLLKFQVVWVLNYSLFIVSALNFLNVKRLKSYNLGFTSLILSILAIMVFLIQGLSVLGDLKEGYINQPFTDYFHGGGFNIGIRYISYVFVGLVLFSTFLNINRDYFQTVSADLKKGLEMLFHITLLWIASSELITWMDIEKFSHFSKLGLTILWGVYALIVIVLGISRKRKHLRVGAIALFGITLYKLFFFDLSDLDTIAKTIVFVSLGVLLLIISFLYNKYKHLISGDIKD